MIYTSGTTGKPKGAMRSSNDPALIAVLLGELNLLHEDAVHLTTGPLYHSGPLAFASLSHTLGAPIVVLRKFDAARWIELVAKHRVTNTFSAPTQLKRIVSLPPDVLAKADMSSMVTLIANAAPVPYSLKEELIAKLGEGWLYEVYGSTELGVDTVLKPEDQLRKPGSCGKPYGGVEIRIVTDDGTVAAPGERGELFVSTTGAMDGYHRTEQQLTEIESGAWKSVGDVAYTDDEGYVYICDRKKDMIISGGVNIYPAEIESVLYGHRQILDAAVFGVPDDEWGESVYAIVQAKPGENIDLDELRGVRRATSRRLQAPPPVRDSSRVTSHRLRQVVEACAPRRVLEGRAALGLSGRVDCVSRPGASAEALSAKHYLWHRESPPRIIEHMFAIQESKAETTERLEAEVCTLAGHIAAATCRLLLLVAELDRRDAWASWGCRSMSQWLSWKCGLGRATAREYVRVARALESLPSITAAFSEGRLSYSKVRALSRVRERRDRSRPPRNGRVRNRCAARPHCRCVLAQPQPGARRVGTAGAHGARRGQHDRDSSPACRGTRPRWYSLPSTRPVPTSRASRARPPCNARPTRSRPSRGHTSEVSGTKPCPRSSSTSTNANSPVRNRLRSCNG